MCREVLTELAGHDLQLFDGSPANQAGRMDFHIWDFKSNLPIPKSQSLPLSNHLFLVYRRDLPSLFECLGRSDAFVLLKPIRRTTLTAFIGMAVSIYESRLSEVAMRHSDHDEIVRCLVQSNLKLQEADHDHADFLARGLHDFRTPLTAILGYCGLLLNEALGPLNERQKEVVRRMDHSTKRLFRMASTMFQLNCSSRADRKSEFDLADIRECVAQAAHEVRPIADGKRISLSVNLDERTPLFRFESGLVEQVLINLLENACKFTPKGGQIEVRGKGFFWDRRKTRNGDGGPNERRIAPSKDPNAYRLDVLDSGGAIPVEQLQNIFADELSNSGHPDRAGGGLGLVICRMVAAQHHGRILAQNTGEGAVFSLILPFRKELEKDASA